MSGPDSYVERNSEQWGQNLKSHLNFCIFVRGSFFSESAMCLSNLQKEYTMAEMTLIKGSHNFEIK